MKVGGLIALYRQVLFHHMTPLIGSDVRQTPRHCECYFCELIGYRPTLFPAPPTLWLDDIPVAVSVNRFFAQWHCSCVSGHVELIAAWPLLAGRWEEPRKQEEPHSCPYREENDHLYKKYGLSPWNSVPVGSKSGKLTNNTLVFSQHIALRFQSKL